MAAPALVNSNDDTTKVTAWPVTQTLLTDTSSSSSSSSSSNSDSLLIKFKIKLDFLCLSNDSNNNNRVVRDKYRAKKYSGTYPVQPQHLTSDNGSPKSRSWFCISEIIAAIAYYIPFSIDKVQWVDHKQRTKAITLHGRDELVQKILEAARFVAAQSAMERPALPVKRFQLHVCIKKTMTFFNYEEFERMRKCDLLKKLITQLQPPLETGTVRREIEECCRKGGIMNKISHNVLDRLTDCVLTRNGQRESLQQETSSSPAAAKEDAMKRMEKFVYDDEDKEECGVCKEKFIGGDFVLRLPCSHIYHSDCVTQ